MIAKILLFAGLLSPVVWAGDFMGYRFNRSVVWQDDGGQSLLGVTLDDSIYNAAGDDYRDLRIKDRNGVEIPYLMQKIAGSKRVVSRHAIDSVIESFNKIGEEGIVVTAKLDKGAVNADGLTIVTQQRDFEYGLQIHGSADGLEWHLLVENAPIYDYSRYIAVDQRDVELPANQYRHFKITVDKAAQTHLANLTELTRLLEDGEELQRSERRGLHYEALRIERIDFWHKQSETVPEEAKSFDYAVEDFAVSQDDELKTTVIDIKTQRQPLTGFVVKTGTLNFSRNAEVQILLQHGIESRWQTIGSATLEALNFQDISHEQSRIGFSEQRRPNYRIVIYNQDSPPLDIIGVNGVGNGYRLLFLSEPGNRYRLYYGNDKAESARYDTAPILELLRRGYPSIAAELDAEVASEAIDLPPDMSELLNSRWFLVGAIGIMLVVLAWSLYRVGKRVGELPKS
ncbi:hypothetical protein [Methylotuvimicrobium sp. KM1]|uniref:hypothetical protein n=1 Tax=Methylotuvimicrobium sp. KM1 TaxID=3377707 RepID=UPI003850E889